MHHLKPNDFLFGARMVNNRQPLSMLIDALSKQSIITNILCDLCHFAVLLKRDFPVFHKACLADKLVICFSHLARQVMALARTPGKTIWIVFGCIFLVYFHHTLQLGKEVFPSRLNFNILYLVSYFACLHLSIYIFIQLLT